MLFLYLIRAPRKAIIALSEPIETKTPINIGAFHTHTHHLVLTYRELINLLSSTALFIVRKRVVAVYLACDF